MRKHTESRTTRHAAVTLYKDDLESLADILRDPAVISSVTCALGSFGTLDEMLAHKKLPKRLRRLTLYGSDLRIEVAWGAAKVRATDDDPAVMRAYVLVGELFARCRSGVVFGASRARSAFLVACAFAILVATGWRPENYAAWPAALVGAMMAANAMLPLLWIYFTFPRGLLPTIMTSVTREDRPRLMSSERAWLLLSVVLGAMLSAVFGGIVAMLISHHPGWWP